MRRQTRANVICGGLFGLIFSCWILFYVYGGSGTDHDVDFAGLADAARDRWRDTADAAMEKWKDTAEVARDTWRAMGDGNHGDGYLDEGDEGEVLIDTGLQQGDGEDDLVEDTADTRAPVGAPALTPATPHRARHREDGHRHPHHDHRPQEPEQEPEQEQEQDAEDRETMREEPRPHQQPKPQHKHVTDDVTPQAPTHKHATDDVTSQAPTHPPPTEEEKHAETVEVTTEEPETTTEVTPREHKHSPKEEEPHSLKPAHRTKDEHDPKHHKHRPDVVNMSQNEVPSVPETPETAQGVSSQGEGQPYETETESKDKYDMSLLEELEKLPDRTDQQQMAPQPVEAMQPVYSPPQDPAVPQNAPALPQNVLAPVQNVPLSPPNAPVPVPNAPVPPSNIPVAAPNVPVVAPNQAFAPAPQPVLQPSAPSLQPQVPAAPHETSPEEMVKLVQPLNTTKKKDQRVDWERFFRFLPNGVQSCPELFPNLADNNPLPNDFKEAFAEYEAMLRSYKIEEANTGDHLEQFIVYYFLVRAPFVNTVCETGFGAGHSTFLWLQANPDVHVYSFDLGEHSYSRYVADYLSQKYQNRLHVVWGDSVKTLPRFREANKNFRCDIVVIDGGHTFRESLSDYFHLRRIVRDNNLVLLDNYPDVSRDYMQTLGNVWEGGKRRGEIIEIFHCDYRPKPHGFSVGRFIPPAQT